MKMNVTSNTMSTACNYSTNASSGFMNASGLKFVDISTEEYRTYEFPAKEYVTIEKPLMLHVSASGGHRVFDAQGLSHYIPKGWIHLVWKAKSGNANFVK